MGANDRGSLSARLAARADGLHRRAAPDGGEVYSGPLARRALKAVGARAMTMDNTIFVDEGFDLSNPEDQALYAHERHHQAESGGTDNHGHNDAEEMAARAIERMVLHRSQKGEDFSTILRDVRDRGHDVAKDYEAGVASQEGEEDELAAAYLALRAAGKSHETVVQELIDFVLLSLETQKEMSLVRTTAARTI